MRKPFSHLYFPVLHLSFAGFTPFQKNEKGVKPQNKGAKPENKGVKHVFKMAFKIS